MFNQNVMEKVSELSDLDFVKFGFDRAGTSTAREKDQALFEKAFALRDEGELDEAVSLLKSTDWWYGYQTSVKQAVKLESQGFDGVLDVTCIKGGFITQLEAAEMERIMREATSDCAKSGITVKYAITEVSYCEFLSEYEPSVGGQMHKPEAEASSEVVPSVAAHGDEIQQGRVASMASRSELKNYAAESVTPLMNQLMERLFHDRPDDVAEYLCSGCWLPARRHGAE